MFQYYTKINVILPWFSYENCSLTSYVSKYKIFNTKPQGLCSCFYLFFDVSAGNWVKCSVQVKKGLYVWDTPLFTLYFKTGSPLVAQVFWAHACLWLLVLSILHPCSWECGPVPPRDSAAKYWSIAICVSEERTYSMICPSNTQLACASQESYILGSWY